jgi:hypothetical protein
MLPRVLASFVNKIWVLQISKLVGVGRTLAQMNSRIIQFWCADRFFYGYMLQTIALVLQVKIDILIVQNLGAYL